MLFRSYVGLLKEELDTLWKTLANTWDATEKEYFPMRVALLMTVHDYLGYGYLAGQVVHGFSRCVRCMDDTTYRQLDRDPGSSKTVFMGHRRWPRDVTRGGNARICSMVKPNPENARVRGAARK